MTETLMPIHSEGELSSKKGFRMHGFTMGLFASFAMLCWASPASAALLEVTYGFSATDFVSASDGVARPGQIDGSFSVSAQLPDSNLTQQGFFAAELTALDVLIGDTVFVSDDLGPISVQNPGAFVYGGDRPDFEGGFRIDSGVANFRDSFFLSFRDNGARITYADFFGGSQEQSLFSQFTPSTINFSFGEAALGQFFNAGHVSVERLVGTLDGQTLIAPATGATISAVPLPAALWFLLSGIAGLGGLRFLSIGSNLPPKTVC